MGAAIAAGSQLEKGNWALFVNAATITNEETKFICHQNFISNIDHPPQIMTGRKAKRINTSPIRFVRIVTNLAMFLFVFK